jgi:SMODS and SLOG-associating 2TM effector domain 3/SMODS and SLOG-associating 2TM effector domain 1
VADESTVEDGFPGLFKAADRAALKFQKRHFRLTLTGLAAGVVAAIGSAISYDLNKHLDVGALLAGVAFAVGAVATAFLLFGKADRAWYESRAAAESIKTLAWQFCVTAGQPDDDRTFGRQARAIARQMRYARLPVQDGNERATDAMREVRARPAAERRRLYLTQRIGDQHTYYLSKADQHARLAKVWLWTMAALQVAGLALAVLRAVNLLNADLLGIAATAAAGALAWVQTKDSQTLAESFRVAADDLADVASEGADLGPLDEEEWAAFVRDGEQAVSREHTLWRARRDPALAADES